MVAEGMHAQMIRTAKTCNHRLSSVDVVKGRFLPYYGYKKNKTSLSKPGRKAATNRANDGPRQRSKIQLYKAPYWSTGLTGSLRSAMLMLMQCFVSIGLRGGENVPLSVSM